MPAVLPVPDVQVLYGAREKGRGASAVFLLPDVFRLLLVRIQGGPGVRQLTGVWFVRVRVPRRQSGPAVNPK